MPDNDYSQVLETSQRVPELTLNETDGAPVVTAYLGGLCNAATLDMENYTVEAITSTNMLDRWDEIIEPTGWKLANYRRNPIMILEHWGGDPIGRSLAEEIRPKGLWQHLQYAPEATETARDVWALVVAGVYRAFSPGWLPLKWESIDPKMPVNGATKGEGWPPGRQRAGIRFTSVEMLELSQVAIPATPNAVLLSLSTSAVNLARTFGEEVPDSPLRNGYGVVARAARLMDRSADLRTAFENALTFDDSGPLGREAAAQARGIVAAAASSVETADTGTAGKDTSAVQLVIAEAACRLRVAGATIRTLL